LRVLHVGKYFPPCPGGMESYLRDLMSAQARQGIEAVALVHRTEAGLCSRSEKYEADGRGLPIVRAAIWGRLVFTPVSPTFPWLLRRLIARYRPDLIHLHLPNPSAFWVLPLAAARKLPWIIHWQSDVVPSRHSRGLRFFYYFYRPLERALLRRSQAIIVTSPPYLASSKPLAEFTGKCHVIPLGLDVARHAGTTTHATGSPVTGALRVLAVGRFTYYKGFEFLIRATALCDNVEVHLVGAGEQLTRLRALSRELGLENRVTFLGQIGDEELHQQFVACDCLCLPSLERTEAFGMVLLEAMWRGKATVVSAVPGSGVGWVVDDGFTGLQVPPGNTAALAAALRDLDGNRDKLRAFGLNGRQKFERLFRIDSSAARISELYRGVLSDDPVGTGASDDVKPE